MAKNSSGTKVVDRGTGGTIQTPFKDVACPVPGAGESDWGPFTEKDSIFTEATPGPTPAVMKETQFADIAGGEPGAKDFMRIPGSSRGGGNYER
jgi:hypothetical protein